MPALVSDVLSSCVPGRRRALSCLAPAITGCTDCPCPARPRSCPTRLIKAAQLPWIGPLASNTPCFPAAGWVAGVPPNLCPQPSIAPSLSPQHFPEVVDTASSRPGQALNHPRRQASQPPPQLCRWVPSQLGAGPSDQERAPERGACLSGAWGPRGVGPWW